MNKQIIVEPAEKSKRLISLLIDIVSLVATSFGLYFLLLYVVIGPMYNYSSNKDRVGALEEQYQLNYNSGREYTDYQNVLYKFYTEYYPDEIEARLKEYFPSEEYTSSTHIFNVLVLDLDIAPRVDDGTYKSKYYQYQLDDLGNPILDSPGVVRSDLSGDDIERSMSNNMYGKYIELKGMLRIYNSEYNNTLRYVNNIKLSSRVIATGLPIIIFAIVIPLCLKHGRTLGNLITDIAIVNSKNGFTIKKYKVFIRALAYYALPLGGIAICNHYSIITMVVFPLFVSTLIMLFGNKEQDLADIISRTAAVDKKTSLFFKSAGEASLYSKKEENQVVTDKEFLNSLENTKKIDLSETRDEAVRESKKDKNS